MESDPQRPADAAGRYSAKHRSMSDTIQGTSTENTTRPRSKQRPGVPNSVIIRPWPKVVFLYPTLLVALVCFFWQLVEGGSEGELGNRFLGNLFTVVFFANMLVFSFDFSRIKTITLVIAVVAIILGLGWADSKWGIATGIHDIVGGIDI